MEYQIKDIAKILNVSTELIRYYEKQGIIHPDRNLTNNYRMYSVMDIFTLLEVNSYKNLGFSVKEVIKLKNTDFPQYFRMHADRLESQLKKEIVRKEALCQRIRDIGDRIETWSYNKDNFWIQKSREKYEFLLVQGNGDIYEKIELSDSLKELLLSPEFMSFCEATVDFDFQTKRNNWWMTIEKKYADVIGMDCKDFCPSRKSVIELCTSSEMGDFGDFSEEAVMPTVEYAKAKGYKIAGKPYACLLGRGKCEGVYKRMLEVHIPVS